MLTASEPLELDSAVDPNHYQVTLLGTRRNRALDVQSVSYDDESNRITLHLRRAVRTGRSVDVSANRLTDRSGNVLNWTGRVSADPPARARVQNGQPAGAFSPLAIDSLLEERMRAPELISEFIG